MLRIIIGFFIYLCSCSVFAGVVPDPEVVKLSDRVYALIGIEEMPNKQNMGLIGNSTLIVGDKGLIVVDSGFTHEIGLSLRRAAEKISSKPITHVINTHSHGDHFLGNTAFPGAEIISSEKCKELVLREGKSAISLIEGLIGAKSPNTKLVPASRTFPENSKTELVINGVRMLIWVPHGSHTAGDLLVYLPDDQVLIAGDILASGAIPNLRDGFVSAWMETLADIKPLVFKSAIPGHGRPMNTKEVDEFTKRLTKLYADIEAGYKKGLSDSEIRESLDLSEWKMLRRFEEMGIAVNRIFTEVESKNF